jgi:hypothetical protein
MSIPGRSPACAGATVLLLLTAVYLILGSPATAALVITNESFIPVPPLVANDAQHAVTAFAVIPSGGTTFIRTHTLQMQTALTGARWNIQVIVDGIPAAQQSASGTSAFVNGYLLSYPTTSDVSFMVAQDGTVPADAGSSVTILQVTELDSAGTPVPGGSLTISAPVISLTPGTVTSPQVSGTQPLAATPAPTRSPGFLPVTCLVAAVVAAAGYGVIRARK